MSASVTLTIDLIDETNLRLQRILAVARLVAAAGDGPNEPPPVDAGTLVSAMQIILEEVEQVKNMLKNHT